MQVSSGADHYLQIVALRDVLANDYDHVINEAIIVIGLQ